MFSFLIFTEIFSTSALISCLRLDIFLEFVEDENNAILLSSHISSDLEKVADYIIFIDNGEIILHESADELRAKEKSSIDEIFRRKFYVK